MWTYPKNEKTKLENIILGDLKIDVSNFDVQRKGRKIQLRRKEFQLLEFLARNKNCIINRNTLLEYIWDYSATVMTNTLDVHISKLRQKIDGGEPIKLIETVYGAGYRLCDKPIPPIDQTTSN